MSDEPRQAEGDDEAEFARLAPVRPPRSPGIAALVIALALLLWGRLSDDSRYALGPHAPRELDRMSDLTHLENNQYVALSGQPDRRNALLFEPKGDRYRRAFFRLMGTGSRLWIAAAETSTEPPAEDRFVGRLRRFDDLPYAAQLRDYYVAKVKSTRFLDLPALRRHLADPAAPLLDRTFEPLSSTSEVAVVVDFPEDLLVSLAKRQFPVEEDARHELTRLGAPLALQGETTEGFLYVVRVPISGRDAYLQQLDQHGFPFAARRVRFAAAIERLGAEAERLKFPHRAEHPAIYQIASGQLGPDGAGETAIPWGQVAAVEQAAPILIPSDAWVILEHQAPEQFSWTLWIDGTLAVFALFNIWQLVRYFRRRDA